jgi:sensor histidine kinase YesM
MTPPAPAASPPDASDHWDRGHLVPTRRQLAVTVTLAVVGALALDPVTLNPFIEVLAEAFFVSMVCLFGFKVAGAWRQTLLPRWVAQLVAVALGAALSPLIVQMLSVRGDFSAFLASRPMVHGYVLVTLSAALIGTLFALGALYRERDAQARTLALQLALERETLQRQAADARLRLLTAQIEPHFLLNTLANVQQLVESGSPRAAAVFRSLIDYLRATLPQLHQQSSTLGDEEGLVRAYLELMLMRMPDRLTFAIAIEPSLRTVSFPPMALLTLVENAIRHGIEPRRGPGLISIEAKQEDKLLHLIVRDNGRGSPGADLNSSARRGIGLANTQARLQGLYGQDQSFSFGRAEPQGCRVDIHLPFHFEPVHVPTVSNETAS